MKTKFLFLFTFLSIFSIISYGKDYLISTAKTSLVISAKSGDKALIQYYGVNIEPDQVSEIYDAGLALWAESYPVFGIHSSNAWKPRVHEFSDRINRSS